VRWQAGNAPVAQREVAENGGKQVIRQGIQRQQLCCLVRPRAYWPILAKPQLHHAWQEQIHTGTEEQQPCTTAARRWRWRWRWRAALPRTGIELALFRIPRHCGDGLPILLPILLLLSYFAARSFADEDQWRRGGSGCGCV
jgi:hypothetical protein